MADLRTCIDREFKDGYMHLTKQYDDAGDYMGQRVTYIPFTMSRDCHHEFRATDPTCGNCKWR